jgi:hypothetical protein
MYKPSNLKELAHSVIDQFENAENSLGAAEQESIVLAALREARKLAPDPAND